MPLSNDPLIERVEPIRKLGQKVWLRYAVAFVSVAAAILARSALHDVRYIGTFLTFYPAVIASATFGRVRGGMLSVVLSVAAADYFLIPPLFSFAVTPGQAVALFLFGINLALIVLAIGLLHEVLDRLSAQHENLKFVLETAPVGLIAVDQDGIITMLNGAIERQLEYSRQELIGTKIQQLLPEQLREAHEVYRNAYMAQPLPRAMGRGADLFARRQDGTEIPVEVGLNPIQREGKVGILATVLDISERKSAERRQRILLHEVQHRARNLLSVVQIIAMRTLSPTHTFAEARQNFLGILGGMIATQELFAAQGSITLREVVEREISPFSLQVEVSGCDVPLSQTAAQNFGLIVHELCTNAVKYGAFSVPVGRVSISGLKVGNKLTLTWSERNGPQVRPPQRRGFGQTVLTSLMGEFDAEISMKYPPSGFEYELVADWHLVAKEGSGSGQLVA